MSVYRFFNSKTQEGGYILGENLAVVQEKLRKKYGSITDVEATFVFSCRVDKDIEWMIYD